MLAAALCVSLGYVAGAMLPPRGLSSLATTLWGVLLGTIVVAPLLLGKLARDGLPHADATAWGAVVWLAVLTSIVGYLGWYWALDRGGIARIATLQFLQPISGFVLAAVDPRRERDGADRDRECAHRRRDRASRSERRLARARARPRRSRRCGPTVSSGRNLG